MRAGLAADNPPQGFSDRLGRLRGGGWIWLPGRSGRRGALPQGCPTRARSAAGSGRQQRFSDDGQASRIDRRTNFGSGGGGPYRIDADSGRSERSLKTNQAGDLRNVDRNALANLRFDRQIQRFLPKIQRAAGRRREFFGLKRDAAIDMCDAVFQRQSADSAFELGRRVDLVKWVYRVGQAIER